MKKMPPEHIKEDDKLIDKHKNAKIVSLADLNAKLDLIIKHQNTVRWIAIFRGVVSFIFFFVFIILPIIGGFYLFRFVRENVDFEKVSGQYLEFYETFQNLKDKLPGGNK